MGRAAQPHTRPNAWWAATPSKVCTTCGETFWTQVGLDEHVRRGDHSGFTRRWGVARTPVVVRRGTDARFGNATRRRCCECGRTSTPAGTALHQKATGHTGWVEA